MTATYHWKKLAESKEQKAQITKSCLHNLYIVQYSVHTERERERGRWRERCEAVVDVDG